jgi:predicted RNase H-like nuclease (RuvC/YqgF family)
LFKKIDSFVKIRKKKNISNRIKKLVITKGISISDALNLIEMPEEKKESRKKRESAIKKEEYESLKNRLREERNKNSILTSQNSELKILLKKSGKDKERLEKRSMGVVDDKKAKKILEFREQRILSFEKEIKQKNKEIEKLQKEISDINRIMANIERDLIAKKLENLGSKEFLKKSKDLNIKKEDLILVNDPNIFSEKTIDFFKGRTEVIISKKNPNKKLSELFNFINKENLSIKERKSFAVISRKDLENQKKKINILSRIVNEYKKNRQK